MGVGPGLGRVLDRMGSERLDGPGGGRRPPGASPPTGPGAGAAGALDGVQKLLTRRNLGAVRLRFMGYIAASVDG